MSLVLLLQQKATTSTVVIPTNPRSGDTLTLTSKLTASLLLTPATRRTL